MLLKHTRILITNDDGIDAPGIEILERAAREHSDDVWVVAPSSNQSSKSRAMTQTSQVRVHRVSECHFAVDGTPSDCAIIGLNGLIPGRPPDLVLSGINAGSNMGEEVPQSGTVGACLQALEQGVPGIAFSQVGTGRHQSVVDWSCARHHAARLLPTLAAVLHEPHQTLNVNFPPLKSPEALRGWVVVPAGLRLGPPTVEIVETDAGGALFSYPDLRPGQAGPEGTDWHEIHASMVTVTPLRLDATHHEVLSELRVRLSSTLK